MSNNISGKTINQLIQIEDITGEELIPLSMKDPNNPGRYVTRSITWNNMIKLVYQYMCGLNNKISLAEETLNNKIDTTVSDITTNVDGKIGKVNSYIDALKEEDIKINRELAYTVSYTAYNAAAIVGLSGNVIALQAEDVKIKSDLSQTTAYAYTKVAENRESINKLEATDVEIKNNLSETTAYTYAKVAETSESINKLQTEDSKIKANISEFKNETSQSINKLKEEDIKLGSNISNLQAEDIKINSNISTLKTETTESISKLEATDVEIKNNLSETNAYALNIGSEVYKISVDITGVTADIEGLKAEDVKIKNDLSETTSYVYSKVAENRESIDKLEAEDAKLYGYVGDLKAEDIHLNEELAKNVAYTAYNADAIHHTNLHLHEVAESLAYMNTYISESITYNLDTLSAYTHSGFAANDVVDANQEHKIAYNADVNVAQESELRDIEEYHKNPWDQYKVDDSTVSVFDTYKI